MQLCAWMSEKHKMHGIEQALSIGMAMVANKKALLNFVLYEDCVYL